MGIGLNHSFEAVDKATAKMTTVADSQKLLQRSKPAALPFELGPSAC